MLFRSVSDRNTGSAKYVLYDGQSVVNFGRQCGHLVAQAEVQRQVGPEFPIVLHIAPDKGYPISIGFSDSRTSDGVQSEGYIGKEVLQRVENKASVRPLNGKFITLQALDEAPELYGVESTGEERVVIILEGIHYVVILR